MRMRAYKMARSFLYRFFQTDDNGAVYRSYPLIFCDSFSMDTTRIGSGFTEITHLYPYPVHGISVGKYFLEVGTNERKDGSLRDCEVSPFSGDLNFFFRLSVLSGCDVTPEALKPYKTLCLAVMLDDFSLCVPIYPLGKLNSSIFFRLYFALSSPPSNRKFVSYASRLRSFFRFRGDSDDGNKNPFHVPCVSDCLSEAGV